MKYKMKKADLAGALGKDGIPFPVDRQVMDQSIQLLRQGIEESKLGKKQALQALERLGSFVKRLEKTR